MVYKNVKKLSLYNRLFLLRNKFSTDFTGNIGISVWYNRWTTTSLIIIDSIRFHILVRYLNICIYRFTIGIAYRSRNFFYHERIRFNTFNRGWLIGGSSWPPRFMSENLWTGVEATRPFPRLYASRTRNASVHKRTNAERKPTPCGLDNFGASTRAVQFDAPAIATNLRCWIDRIRSNPESQTHVTILGYLIVVISLPSSSLLLFH